MWGCAGVAIWLVGYTLLHLSSSLPPRYLANHWTATWVGLDLGMAACALATLGLLMHGSRFAAISAAALATLLVADAWFDCMTAQRHDVHSSLLSLVAELPAAAFFLWIAVTETRRLGRDPHT
jgi:hypothetical protein